MITLFVRKQLFKLNSMKPFLTGAWKNLVMLNYAAEPAALQKHLPKGTEIDIWNGTCYISIVGFMFLNTRVKGISLPGYRNFEELNLRFYVRFKEAGVWKRGVVFVKEIVPRRLITTIANTIYGEHYACYPMRNTFLEEDNHISLGYEWYYENEWNHLQVTAEKSTTPLPENSEAEFITEHFWGYTKLASGNTSEYEVAHPRWNIHKVLSHHFYCNTKALYGDDFHPYLQQQPVSAFLAQGSDVKVYPRKLWKF